MVPVNVRMRTRVCCVGDVNSTGRFRQVDPAQRSDGTRGNYFRSRDVQRSASQSSATAKNVVRVARRRLLSNVDTTRNADGL